jgi:hypothetical protein
MHAGIDLAGPIGTPIYATADGTVLRAGWNSGGYGNLVKIDHGRGIETRYGHLVGDPRPRRPARHARPADRPHGLDRPLDRQPPHYEVRIDGRAVNPIPFMKSTDYLLAMQRKNGVGTPFDGRGRLGGPTARKR